MCLAQLKMLLNIWYYWVSLLSHDFSVLLHLLRYHKVLTICNKSHITLMYTFMCANSKSVCNRGFKVWHHCLSTGLGYGSQVVVLYTGVYYIIILAWTFLYLFSSFRSELPWASCNNSWNTGAITSYFSSMTYTAVYFDKSLFNLSFIFSPCKMAALSLGTIKHPPCTCMKIAHLQLWNFGSEYHEQSRHLALPFLLCFL